FLTVHRFAGVQFFPDGNRLLVTDFDRDRRWTKTVVQKLDAGPKASAPPALFDRSSQDRYHDPGTPVTRRLPNGRSALWEVDGKLCLSGAGASPKGARPSLDRLTLADGKTERLFQCDAGEYATAGPLTDTGSKLLVRRESPADPGNYFLRVGGNETPITTFTD